MLELMRDYFKLDSNAMHREIQAMHVDVIQALKKKGIQYADLKAALVPATDRHEAGFVFDTREISSSWYGEEVAQQFLPLLGKQSTQSVLCGDLIGDNQEIIFNVLDKHMILSRSFEFVHGSALYCVYINNLSATALAHLHERLRRYRPYLGYIPATYQTFAKTYLSTTLVNTFLKQEGTVLMGHEDDRPDEENVNMVGYPFDDFGYKVRSIQSTQFDVFLGFKIERAVYPGFQVDTEMALNAVSQHIVPLEDCAVELHDAKFGYLQREKRGKLLKAGLGTLGRDQLATLIKEKVAGSYLYNLVFLEKHNVVKFNLIVEVPDERGRNPTRFVAALEYKPAEKLLRLITLT